MKPKKTVAKKVVKKGVTPKQALGIGLGLTAAAAAVAGAYFLYGSKDAAKNRAAVKSWALKAKAEVLEGIEKTKEMTQDEYEALVDTVTATYAAAKSASRTDLATFKKEMKEQWGGLMKVAHPTVKKAAKKVAKKVAKK